MLRSSRAHGTSNCSPLGPNVLLWHGEHDTNAPPTMGHWLTQALPNCTSRFVAGEGHISLIVNWAEAIFREAGT